MTNHLRVDFRGISECGLCCPLFADGLEAGLLERLSVPKQQLDGLRRRVVTGDRVAVDEPHRATVPYLGAGPGKGGINQLLQHIADCAKRRRLSSCIPGASNLT